MINLVVRDLVQYILFQANWYTLVENELVTDPALITRLNNIVKDALPLSTQAIAKPVLSDQDRDKGDRL